MQNKKILVTLLVIAIVSLAFFLRIYNIDNTPPGVYPDEAVNGEDAVRAIETGDFQWFYPANQGREGLFINLVALCFKLFGVSVLALKLPAIISGTLTAFGTYLLGKEIFSRRAGLIGAYLVAVSFWAINFSRISFRANMLPLVLVFSFYFLWKGIRTKAWSNFALAGLIFGIGLHTYIAFRIAPAILLCVLFSMLLTRPGFFKEYWKKILIFVAGAVISAAPMLYTFFIAHPEYLESRSGNISVFSPQVNHGHPAQTLAKSFVLSLAKYNFFGDMNWRHNFPPYPILDTASGIAFLFGFILVIWQALRLLVRRFKERIQDPRLDVCVFLLAWFFAMLAPEFLTAEGNPHALRAIGTLPVVFLFAGMTFDLFLREAEEHGWIFKKITLFLIIAILLSIGIFNSVKYHLVWSNRIETARSFEKVLMDVSAYLRTVPAEKEKFVVTGSMQRIPIKLFNNSMPNLYFIYPGQAADIAPHDQSKMEIIFTERNDEIIKMLIDKFDNLSFSEAKDRLGISYYILK